MTSAMCWIVEMIRLVYSLLISYTFWLLKANTLSVFSAPACNMIDGTTDLADAEGLCSNGLHVMKGHLFATA